MIRNRVTAMVSQVLKTEQTVTLETTEVKQRVN